MTQIIPASQLFAPQDEKEIASSEAQTTNAIVIPRSALSDAIPTEESPQTDREKSKSWYQDLYGSFEKSYLAGFNEQVATMLQTPISAGLELYQMGFGGNVNPNLPNYDPDDHVMGARAVKDLFEAIGINVTPKEDSLGARIGQETAYGLAGYGVLGAAADRKSTRLTPVTQ